MGFFTKRFPKEFFIKRYDFRILVRFPDDLIGVFLVDGFHTGFQYRRIASVERLSRPANTSAGASHNLNSVEVVHTTFDTVQQLSGIPQGMSYTNMDGCSVKVYRGLTDAF